MVAGGRRPEGRHRVVDAELGEGHDVHVAFHHHEPGGPAPPAAQRLVLAVELPALAEHRPLRRVEVLRLPFPDDPAAEPDHPPPAVADREHHPVPEPIVVPARVPADDEAGALERARARIAERGRQPLPAGRREPEVEPRRELARHPAGLQVLDRPRASRVFPELAPEVPARPVERRVDGFEISRPAAPLPCFPTGARSRRLHADAGGELLHRIDEPEAVELHQEGDRGAARPASEAVVDLLLATHAERRRPLLVERAASEEVAAPLPQPHPGLDHVDDVHPREEVVDERRGYASECACHAGSLLTGPAARARTPVRLAGGR